MLRYTAMPLHMWWIAANIIVDQKYHMFRAIACHSGTCYRQFIDLFLLSGVILLIKTFKRYILISSSAWSLWLRFNACKTIDTQYLVQLNCCGNTISRVKKKVHGFITLVIFYIKLYLHKSSLKIVLLGQFSAKEYSWNPRDNVSTWRGSIFAWLWYEK